MFIYLLYEGVTIFQFRNMEIEMRMEPNKVYCWINMWARLGNVGLQVLHIRLGEDSGVWWEFRLEV